MALTSIAPAGPWDFKWGGSGFKPTGMQVKIFLGPSTVELDLVVPTVCQAESTIVFQKK
jgi:hypothetical protein